MILHGPEMSDKVVFKRWVDKKDPCFQYVFDDINIADFQKNLENGSGNKYITEFNRLLRKSSKKPYLTKSIIDFFCLDPLRPDKFELTDKVKERLSNVYSYLESDINQFIEYIKLHEFSDELINKVECKTNFLTVINKYKNFVQLLFANSDPFLTQNNLFCVANNLFEFCFYPKTALKFEQLLKSPENYPIVRMFYSIMWNYLAGQGWKDWSRSTLSSIRDLTKNGETVVYIAGGTDIYQLLKYGIYNITVIDPVLPSQPDYYSDIWDWLVVNKTENNGIGDVVNYDFGNRKLVMKRTTFDKLGFFKAELSFGKVIDIIQSRTEWTVFDDLYNELGKVVFERRFCRQDDFVKKDNSHLLISFNELYYIASNNLNDSWGIDISKLDDNFKMFVKQLRNPVNKDVLCNMQKADNSDFSFIKLGSNTR